MDILKFQSSIVLFVSEVGIQFCVIVRSSLCECTDIDLERIFLSSPHLPRFFPFPNKSQEILGA